MKKKLTKLIIIAILFSGIVLPTKKVEAGLPVIDWYAMANKVADIIAGYTKDVIVKKVVNSTANWVNGGFDKDGPSFVKHWDDFLKDTAIGALEYSYLSIRAGIKVDIEDNKEFTKCLEDGIRKIDDRDQLAIESGLHVSAMTTKSHKEVIIVTCKKQFPGKDIDISFDHSGLIRRSKEELEKCVDDKIKAIEDRNKVAIADGLAVGEIPNDLINIINTECKELNKLIDFRRASDYSNFSSTDSFGATTIKRDIARILAKTGVNDLIKDKLKIFTNSYYLDEVAGDNWENDIIQGGWLAYTALADPANNKLGIAMVTRDLALEKIEEAKKSKIEDITAGAGKILAKIVCKKKSDLRDTNNNPICAENSTVTPGMLVGNQLANSMGSDLKTLENADTWEEVLIASITTLSDALVNAGLTKLTKSLVGGDKNENTASFIEEDGGEEDETYPEREGTRNDSRHENISIGGPEHANRLKSSDWVSAPTVIVNLEEDLEINIEYIREELSYIRMEENLLRNIPITLQGIDLLLPGPDQGWEDRLNKLFERNTKELKKKSENRNNDNAEKGLELLADFENQLEISIKEMKASIKNPLFNIPGSLNIIFLLESFVDGSVGKIESQKDNIDKIERTKSTLINIKNDIDQSKSFIKNKNISYENQNMKLNDIIMFEDDWTDLEYPRKNDLTEKLLGESYDTDIDELQMNAVMSNTWNLWRELLETDDIVIDDVSGKEFKKGIRYRFNIMRNNFSNINNVQKALVSYEQIESNITNLKLLLSDLLQLKDIVEELNNDEKIYIYLKNQDIACSGKKDSCEFKTNFLINKEALNNSIFAYSLRNSINQDVIIPELSSDDNKLIANSFEEEWTGSLQVKSAKTIVEIYEQAKKSTFLCKLTDIYITRWPNRNKNQWYEKPKDWILCAGSVFNFKKGTYTTTVGTGGGDSEETCEQVLVASVDFSRNEENGKFDGEFSIGKRYEDGGKITTLFIEPVSAFADGQVSDYPTDINGYMFRDITTADGQVSDYPTDINGYMFRDITTNDGIYSTIEIFPTGRGILTIDDQTLELLEDENNNIIGQLELDLDNTECEGNIQDDNKQKEITFQYSDSWATASLIDYLLLIFK